MFYSCATSLFILLCNTQTIRNNIAKDCLTENGLDHSTNSKKFVEALYWSNSRIKHCSTNPPWDFVTSRERRKRPIVPGTGKREILCGRALHGKMQKEEVRQENRARSSSWEIPADVHEDLWAACQYSKAKARAAMVRSKIKNWVFNAWFR